MADGELRVDTNDLRAKANEIDALKWASPHDQPPITPPSKLSTSLEATANLVKNVESVWEHHACGFTEAHRLSQSLYLVGKAYDQADLRARDEINHGRPISSGAVKPDDNSIPPPAHPGQPGMPAKVGKASGDPEEVETLLKDGDQGAALQTVAQFWRNIGADLQTAAEPFQVRIRNWEGAAAEVAYGRFNDLGGWLHSLAGTFEQLAGEADRIRDAHKTARAEHTPIYDKWIALKKDLETASDDQKQDILKKLLELYVESEHVRAQYAADATINRVVPPEPHDGDVSRVPVYSNGDPRRPAVPSGGEGQQPGSGHPGGGGGGAPGGAPQGGAPSPMGQPGSSPQPARSGGAPGGTPGGGSGGGKSGGGGKPGGGLPGGMPGGMPAAAKTAPHLPKEPAVKPAAHGGAGAGGGGGAPRSPLQPAVGANAVAPSHAAEAAGQGAQAAQPAQGGAIGGGMGGMPMGAHGQGQGKERRRTPGLSPDEELYTEDRAWTEGIIGHRRRRDVTDAKDGRESK